ncbi:MAG: serine hydrolase domain-containing protein [Clostridium sp.]
MKKRFITLGIVLICSTMITLGAYNENSKDKTKDEVSNVSVSNEDVKKEDITEKEEVDEKADEVVSAGYENLDAFLKDETLNNRFQGSTLVAKGDEILFAKSYGYADRDDNRENTLNTRFAIASNTKQFTAAAIMQLVDENKINLNETIDKYFPEYKYGFKITIRDLIQMRSGMPDYLNEIDMFFLDDESKNIIKEYENGNYYDKYVEDKRWNSEIILRNLYLTELQFEPNSTYDYCNTNYYLLGLIIEKVSGLSYEDYIKENIFEPCEMTTSSFEIKKSDAKGHGSDVSGEIDANPDLTYAAGAIHANVFDVFKWNRMLHTGNIVSKKSYNDMITPIDKYGYGLFIEGNIIRHSGVIDGFNSNTEYDIANDYTIIVLENADAKVVNLDAKYYSDRIREYMDENF